MCKTIIAIMQTLHQEAPLFFLSFIFNHLVNSQKMRTLQLQPVLLFILHMHFSKTKQISPLRSQRIIESCYVTMTSRYKQNFIVLLKLLCIYICTDILLDYWLSWLSFKSVNPSGLHIASTHPLSALHHLRTFKGWEIELIITHLFCEPKHIRVTFQCCTLFLRHLQENRHKFTVYRTRSFRPTSSSHFCKFAPHSPAHCSR